MSQHIRVGGARVFLISIQAVQAVHRLEVYRCYSTLATIFDNNLSSFTYRWIAKVVVYVKPHSIFNLSEISCLFFVSRIIL